MRNQTIYVDQMELRRKQRAQRRREYCEIAGFALFCATIILWCLFTLGKLEAAEQKRNADAMTDYCTNARQHIESLCN